MKKNEKKMITILVIITAIVIAIYVVRQNKKEETPNDIQNQNEVTQTQIKDKEINGINVSNISISENNGDITVTANVTNNTGVTKEESIVKIKLKNAKGEVIQELGALIGKTNPGETRQISAVVGGVETKEIADIEITE